MDTISHKKIEWHYETMPRQTKKALDFFSEQGWLQQSRWYLAGGTALALFTGHRRSVDLDFFNTQRHFRAKQLLEKMEQCQDWNVTINKDDTIYGQALGAKVSFIAYPFFIPTLTPILHGTVRVLQPRDIAVMKLVAISQRGRKRDFYDLYWCAHYIEPLEQLIKRLRVQYPSVAHDYHHILKSIIYFEDAESDPEPTIYFDVTWKKVKAFFEREVPRIMGRIVY